MNAPLTPAERRYRELADSHFRNSVRLARRLVAAEGELRQLKKERAL